MEQVFWASDPDRLRLVAIDELSVLFDRRSGITHVVVDPVPAILSVLSTEPQSVSAILKRLRRDFDLSTVEHGESAATVVEARLAELNAMGIVDARPA